MEGDGDGLTNNREMREFFRWHGIVYCDPNSSNPDKECSFLNRVRGIKKWLNVLDNTVI